jgi:hypothetical protein
VWLPAYSQWPAPAPAPPAFEPLADSIQPLMSLPLQRHYLLPGSGSAGATRPQLRCRCDRRTRPSSGRHSHSHCDRLLRRWRQLRLPAAAPLRPGLRLRSGGRLPAGGLAACVGVRDCLRRRRRLFWLADGLVACVGNAGRRRRGGRSTVTRPRSGSHRHSHRDRRRRRRRRLRRPASRRRAASGCLATGSQYSWPFGFGRDSYVHRSAKREQSALAAKVLPEWTIPSNA